MKNAFKFNKNKNKQNTAKLLYENETPSKTEYTERNWRIEWGTQEQRKWINEGERGNGKERPKW